MLSVFDTYVNSVFTYGSEVWGCYSPNDNEKVHLQCCKRVLSIRKRTCNYFV